MLEQRLPKGYRARGDLGRHGEGGYPKILIIGTNPFMDGPLPENIYNQFLIIVEKGLSAMKKDSF